MYHIQIDKILILHVGHESISDDHDECSKTHQYGMHVLWQYNTIIAVIDH